jgi:hypothetical protein
VLAARSLRRLDRIPGVGHTLKAYWLTPGGSPNWSASLLGQARVIDGDALEVEGVWVRLRVCTCLSVADGSPRQVEREGPMKHRLLVLNGPDNKAIWSPSAETPSVGATE